MILHHGIKAIVWDVDGVLVDTETLHFAAWRTLLAELSHELTLDEYRPMIGRGAEVNMAAMCAAKGIVGDQTALTARRWAMYQELRQHGIPVIAENVALLKEFAAHYPTMTQAVVSNSTAAHIAEDLKTAGVTAHLKFFLS